MNHKLSINPGVRDIVQTGAKDPERLRSDLQTLFESAMIKQKCLSKQSDTGKNARDKPQTEQYPQALSFSDEKDLFLGKTEQVNAHYNAMAFFNTDRVPVSPINLARENSRHPDFTGAEPDSASARDSTVQEAQNSVLSLPAGAQSSPVFIPDNSVHTETRSQKLPVITQASLTGSRPLTFAVQAQIQTPPVTAHLIQDFDHQKDLSDPVTASTMPVHPERIPQAVTATADAEPDSASVRDSTVQEAQNSVLSLPAGAQNSSVFIPDNPVHTETRSQNAPVSAMLTPAPQWPSGAVTNRMPLFRERSRHPGVTGAEPDSGSVRDSTVQEAQNSVLSLPAGAQSSPVFIPDNPVHTETLSQNAPVSAMLTPALQWPSGTVTNRMPLFRERSRHPSVTDAEPDSGSVRDSTVQEAQNSVLSLPADAQSSPVFIPDNPVHTETLSQNEPVSAMLTPALQLPSGTVTNRRPLFRENSRSPGLVSAEPQLPVIAQASLTGSTPLQTFAAQTQIPTPSAARRVQDPGNHQKDLPDSVTATPAPAHPALLPQPQAVTTVATGAEPDSASTRNSTVQEAQNSVLSLPAGVQSSPVFISDSFVHTDPVAKNEMSSAMLTSPQLTRLIDSLTVHIHTLTTRQDTYLQCQLMLPVPGTVAINIGIHAGELRIAIQAPPEIQKQLMRSHHELLIRLQRRHPAQTVMLNFDNSSDSEKSTTARYHDLHDEVRED